VVIVPVSSTDDVVIRPVIAYPTLVVEALNNLSAAEVNAEVDTALADYDPPTKDELDTAESNIRGADSDTLKSISDQLDTAQADLDNPDQFKADVASLATAASIVALQTDITFLKDVAGGKWSIDSDNNQLVFYKYGDNDTELMRFDLKDADGDAAVSSVFSRTPTS
jgi:hypothetical protein